MTSEAAILWAITNYLRADEELRTIGNGVFYKRADAGTLWPHLTWHLVDNRACDTFEDEHHRDVKLRIVANWRDQDGVNYLHASRLMERVLYLLNAKKLPDMQRIIPALNQHFENTGYHIDKCRETTGGTPPMEMPIGDDLTEVAWTTSILFDARILPTQNA